MDYHLDKKLRFGTDHEHKSLYSWYIAEIDDSGDKVGRDQIPWGWTQAFTATELVLSDQLTINTASEEGVLPRREENTRRRIIRAKLRTGEPRRDGDWYHQTTYRFFGTDREIKDFRLDILPLSSAEEKESCTAWGTPSYTSETDFRNETEDDVVIFYLQVRQETFEKMVSRIVLGSADEVILAVGAVEGFYSEWSPSITTRDVKVLARGKEQDVEMPAGMVFELPRLGPVGEASLYINGIRAQARKPIDDEGEPQAAPLVRPEAVPPPSFAASDNQTAALLKSLHGTGRWIIGLLVLLILVTIWR